MRALPGKQAGGTLPSTQTGRSHLSFYVPLEPCPPCAHTHALSTSLACVMGPEPEPQGGSGQANQQPSNQDLFPPQLVLAHPYALLGDPFAGPASSLSFLPSSHYDPSHQSLQHKNNTINNKIDIGSVCRQHLPRPPTRRKDTLFVCRKCFPPVRSALFPTVLHSSFCLPFCHSLCHFMYSVFFAHDCCSRRNFSNTMLVGTLSRRAVCEGEI